ncbi:MAG: O-Antigen ligase [Cyanobacteria bacterium RYN_339]|nr:O-Antigen ligase [Cyanobacteria bacterium RYN_339]
MPYWLLPWGLFLFLLPFEEAIYRTPLGLAFNLLGVFAAGLLALVPRAARDAATPKLVATCVLMALLSLSFFTSIDPRVSRDMLVPIGYMFLTYVLATLTPLTDRELGLSFRCWMWGGAAASVCTLYAFSQGVWDVDHRAYLGWEGAKTDPNILVAALVMPFAVALKRLPRHRLESVAALIPIVLATVATQSRGGVLALLIVTGIFMVHARRYKTLAGGLALIVAFYLAFASQLGRFDVAEDPTGSRRTEIWHTAMVTTMDHWATGIGMDTFPLISAGAPSLYWERAPHNTYLQAFLEAGLPAFLAVLWAMGAHLVIRGQGAWRRTVTAAMVALAMCGMSLHLLTFKLLWMAWAASAQAERARPEDLPKPRRSGKMGAVPS